MASTIQIKRGTGSAVPSGLADGELAINLDNRRLYFGSGSTSVNDFSFGEITAEKYIVSSSVLYVTTSFSSGSTEFGDTADDTHTFIGHITSSGNVSASGDIKAHKYQSNGKNVGWYNTNPLSETVHLGYNNNTSIQIGKVGNPTTIVGHVTASGNVSASGTVIASNLSGTNTGDQDLSSYSTITQLNASSSTLQTNIDAKQDSIGNEDLTIQQTDGLQDALNGKVDDSQVLTNVPANAVFTDTVYTHPANHSISFITGLQSALDAKQDGIGSEDLNIAMTDGLQGALDAKSSITQLNASSSTLQTNIDGKQATLTFGISNTNIIKAGAGIVDNDFLRINGTTLEGRSAAQVLNDIGGQVAIGTDDLTIAMTDGLQDALDAKVDDSQVLTNVPANAVFTDTNTTYSVQDGELSQNNFTDADHTKLNEIEPNATADQTKADIDALGIAATTAVSLTAGDKTIDGNLGLGGDDGDSHYVTRLAHSDNDGGRLYVQAGTGGGTNKPGGSLILEGGASTGNADGGSIIFGSSAAGSSGTSVNNMGLLGSINSTGNLSIEGDLTVKGNDIKDDDGTTCITFDSSGNTTIANTLNATLTGNVTGQADTVATIAGLAPDTATTQATQGNITSLGTLTALTVSGDINANGNIVGDDGTNITNISSIECDSLVHDGDTDTKITFGADSIRFTAGNNIATNVSTTLIDNNLPLKNKFNVSGDTAGNIGGGDVVFFGGTTSMTTGAIYHYKSDGTWELADATDNTKADGLLGVALGAASDTNGVLLRGMVTLDHDAGAIGDPIYLTTTAGDASATAPGNSGNVVRHLGYKIHHATEGQVWFNPSNDWIEIA